jgi:hypothetical protein
MTLPSKADFDDVIAVLQTEYPKSNENLTAILHRIGDPSNSKKIRQEEAKQLLVDYWSFMSKKWNTYASTNAHRWMINQPIGKEVLSLIDTGRRNGQLKHPHISPEAWITKNIAFIDRDEQMPRSFSAIFTYPERYLHWREQIFYALREYHFAETVNFLSSNRARLSRLMDDLERIDTELIGLLKWSSGARFIDPQLSEIHSGGRGSFTWRRGKYALDAIPVLKNSRMRREHLFIWRVFHANQAFRRGTMAAVIVELFRLEGFQNIPDDRTIERACAHYRQTYGKKR